MNDDDDPIARVNLHVWQPPPPRPVDTALLLNRMVAPAAPPGRSKWIIAALATMNVALVAALLVALLREERPRVVTLAAGGPMVDSGTRDALRRLEAQQAQLAQQLAEVAQAKEAIQSLSARLAQCEQKTAATPPVKEPKKQVAPTDTSPLDAVLEAPKLPPDPDASVPESLTRGAIETTIAGIRYSIQNCGSTVGSGEPVRIKVRVLVAPSGSPVTRVIEDGSMPTIAQCVVQKMNKARFPRTQRGGTFVYPFLLGVVLE